MISYFAGLKIIQLFQTLPSTLWRIVEIAVIFAILALLVGRKKAFAVAGAVVFAIFFAWLYNTAPFLRTAAAWLPSHIAMVLTDIIIVVGIVIMLKRK